MSRWVMSSLTPNINLAKLYQIMIFHQPRFAWNQGMCFFLIATFWGAPKLVGSRSRANLTKNRFNSWEKKMILHGHSILQHSLHMESHPCKWDDTLDMVIWFRNSANQWRLVSLSRYLQGFENIQTGVVWDFRTINSISATSYLSSL